MLIDITGPLELRSKLIDIRKSESYLSFDSFNISLAVVIDNYDFKVSSNKTILEKEQLQK